MRAIHQVKKIRSKIVNIKQNKSMNGKFSNE